jgi:predicted transcriptional regulator
MLKAALAKYTRVEDVMTHDVVAIPVAATPSEAAAMLSRRRIGGAPVTDEGRIVGLVSKSDLIDERAAAAATVADIMTRLLFAVRPGDPLMLAVQLMVDESIHRVVVVHEAGGVCGIVAPIDVLRALREGKVVGPVTNDGPLELDYVDLRKL